MGGLFPNYAADRAKCHAANAQAQPLLDADPAFTLDDYFPIVLAQFQRDHKLYGLPYGLDLRALIVAMDRFIETGGDTPPRLEYIGERP